MKIYRPASLKRIHDAWIKAVEQHHSAKLRELEDAYSGANPFDHLPGRMLQIFWEELHNGMCSECGPCPVTARAVDLYTTRKSNSRSGRDS